MREGGFWIGKVWIPGYTVLAPMAGVTDLAYRRLCKEQGASLLCMEMISAKAISYHNKNTKELMEIWEGEHPVSMQLFGKEPELMGEVARATQDHPFDILDINMGCPVPKVVGNGEGSALLKDPALAERIVKSVAGAIQKPVTVKMRIGFSGMDLDVRDFARRMEEAGAAAIAVHARTREEYYSGKAHWEAIAKVKEAVSIPVIGNGDVTGPLEAEALMRETNCDGVMIGRAARGNPWIFAQVERYLATGELLPGPTIEERRDMILRHARAQVAFRGERAALREMRKHVAWYTAGMPGGARFRREANAIETLMELEELLSRLRGPREEHEALA